MVLAAVINTERATFPLGQKNAVHVTQYAFSLNYWYTKEFMHHSKI